MKTLAYILSVILILFGVGICTLPIAIFSSPRELTALSVTIAVIVCIIAFCFVAAGVQHIRKKNRNTALVVISTSGFMFWMALNSQAMQFVKSKDDYIWQFGAFVLPILVCYYATKALKKLIRQKYGE